MLVTQQLDADVGVRSVVDCGALKAEGEGFIPGAAWSLIGVSGHFHRGVDAADLMHRAHVRRSMTYGDVIFAQAQRNRTLTGHRRVSGPVTGRVRSVFSHNEPSRETNKL
jgi:hypothetical protein